MVTSLSLLRTNLINPRQAAELRFRRPTIFQFYIHMYVCVYMLLRTPYIVLLFILGINTSSFLDTEHLKHIVVILLVDIGVYKYLYTYIALVRSSSNRIHRPKNVAFFLRCTYIK